MLASLLGPLARTQPRAFPSLGHDTLGEDIGHVGQSLLEDIDPLVPRKKGADVLEEALADVSDVLSEGIVAQRRESAWLRPGQGTQ